MVPEVSRRQFLTGISAAVAATSLSAAASPGLAGEGGLSPVFAAHDAQVSIWIAQFKRALSDLEAAANPYRAEIEALRKRRGVQSWRARPEVRLRLGQAARANRQLIDAAGEITYAHVLTDPDKAHQAWARRVADDAGSWSPDILYI